MDPLPPPEEVVARLRAIALTLPETREEEAWRGTRWRVRQATVAHVLTVLPDRPSAYAEATGLPGPAVVMTFRSTGDELLALSNAGLPFYKPDWSPTIVGLVLDDDTDWEEVAELVTDSYRCCAPQKLVRQLDGQLRS
ncbi:MAG: hypothetical protein JWO46_2737 [Nocardioidaceae bacterium]|nr:hypothetical protein [Nocardioidaceae bacterium]